MQPAAVRPVADTAKQAAPPLAASSGPKSKSTELMPTGWGSSSGKVAAGSSGAAAAAASNKPPSSWTAVSAELTKELETELSGLVSSAAAKKPLDGELSAPYANPTIPQVSVGPRNAMRPQQPSGPKGEGKQAQQQQRVEVDGAGTQPAKLGRDADSASAE